MERSKPNMAGNNPILRRSSSNKPNRKRSRAMSQLIIDFDQVFHSIGGAGRFQYCLFALLGLNSILGTEIIWFNFIAYKMDHFCHVPELDALPYNVQRDVAIPAESASGSGYSQCQYYQSNYSAYSNETFLQWNRSEFLQTNPTIVDCDSWVYNQSVFVRTAVSQFDLVCKQRGWLVDFVSSITIAGSVLGATAVGSLADKYGRRMALLLSVLFKVVGSLVAATVPDLTVFFISRFVVGIGSATTYQIGFVYLMEMVGREHRNKFGLLYAVLFSFASMMCAGVAYFVRDYGTYQLVLTIPAFFMFLYPVIIPESPRWLLIQDRREEAITILQKIARVNNMKVHSSVLEKIHVDIDTSEDSGNRNGVLDLFRTPRLRKRSFILMYIWFTVSLIFFALSLGAGNLAGDIFLNSFLLSMVEVPCNLLAMCAIQIPAIGRKRMTVFCFCLSGLSCLVCVPALIFPSAGSDLMVTIFSLLGKGGAAASWNILYLYTTELFPTEVRNTGLGASNTASRTGGILASYAGNSLREVWLPLPFIIFGVMGTGAGLLSLLLPETLGETLHETIEQVEAAPKVVKKKRELKHVDNGNVYDTSSQTTL